MKYLVDEDFSMWLFFRRYEIKEGPDGRKYITPDQKSLPRPYNMQARKDELVLDAVNVGLMVLGRKSEDVIQEAVMEFVSKYGLLGMMTALPVTPEYMEYDITFFPPNRFIREKAMNTDNYQKIFFPFHELQSVRKNLEPDWEDHEQLKFWGLRNIVANQPSTVRMSFMSEYSEPYDWVVTQFKDWAYLLTSCYFFYKDGMVKDLKTNLALQQGVSAFGGVFPSYYMVLRERPTIKWEFNSLQQCIHLMLSFMLSDEKNPLRLCKYCHNAYIVADDDSWFCSEECKRKYTSNAGDFDLDDFIGDEW